MPLPQDSDPVIEVYKRDIDRTLIRQNLKRPVTERFEQAMALQRFAEELTRAGREARKNRKDGTGPARPSEFQINPPQSAAPGSVVPASSSDAPQEAGAPSLGAETAATAFRCGASYRKDT